MHFFKDLSQNVKKKEKSAVILFTNKVVYFLVLLQKMSSGKQN